MEHLKIYMGTWDGHIIQYEYVDRKDYQKFSRGAIC